MCVGQSVCVTSMRSCVLRGWRGNNILCVTDQSDLHTNYTHTPVDNTHTDSQSDTPPLITMSRAEDDVDCEEAEPELDNIQSSLRLKRSRIINYQVKYSKHSDVIGCKSVYMLMSPVT